MLAILIRRTARYHLSGIVQKVSTGSFGSADHVPSTAYCEPIPNGPGRLIISLPDPRDPLNARSTESQKNRPR